MFLFFAQIDGDKALGVVRLAPHSPRSWQPHPKKERNVPESDKNEIWQYARLFPPLLTFPQNSKQFRRHKLQQISFLVIKSKLVSAVAYRKYGPMSVQQPLSLIA